MDTTSLLSHGYRAMSPWSFSSSWTNSNGVNRSTPGVLQSSRNCWIAFWSTKRLLDFLVIFWVSAEGWRVEQIVKLIGIQPNSLPLNTKAIKCGEGVTLKVLPRFEMPNKCLNVRAHCTCARVYERRNCETSRHRFDDFKARNSNYRFSTFGNEKIPFKFHFLQFICQVWRRNKFLAPKFDVSPCTIAAGPIRKEGQETHTWPRNQVIAMELSSSKYW